MAGFWNLFEGMAPWDANNADVGNPFSAPNALGTSAGLAQLGPGGVPSAWAGQGPGGAPAMQQGLLPLPGAPDPWAAIRNAIGPDLLGSGPPSAAAPALPTSSQASQPAASAFDGARPMTAADLRLLPPLSGNGWLPMPTGTATSAPGSGNRAWTDIAGRLSDFFNSPQAPAMLMAMAGGFGGARSLGEGLGRAASNTANVMSRLAHNPLELRQVGTNRQGRPILAWVNRLTQQVTPINQ